MLKAALDPDEAAAERDIIKDILFSQPDERGDIGGDLLRRMRVEDVIWIDKERFRHAADGELLAVAVEDCTAQRLNAKLIAALIAHALCERIPLNDLQIGIAERQYNEQGEHQEGDDADAALNNRSNIFHLRLNCLHCIFPYRVIIP